MLHRAGLVLQKDICNTDKNGYCGFKHGWHLMLVPFFAQVGKLHIQSSNFAWTYFKVSLFLI